MQRDVDRFENLLRFVRLHLTRGWTKEELVAQLVEDGVAEVVARWATIGVDLLKVPPK